MNLKKELFAIQYLRQDCDVKLASEAAGITKATANKWLKETGVKDYLERLRDDIEKVVGISKAKVVKMQLDIHKDAMEGDPILDKDGEEIGRKKDRSNARQSLDSVARLMGYDAPKKIDVDVDLSVWLTQQDSSFTREEPEAIDVKPE